MLDLLDLTPHDQAVYELLVDGPAMTQAELAATVTPSVEVASVMASLETKGLVSRIPGSPARFAAVAPELALESLFLEQERKLKQARSYITQLSARFQRSGTSRDPAELVEIISGRTAIRQRSEQLQRSAKEQFRGVDKPPYTVDSVDNSDQEPVEAEMLRSGVRYRVIYDTAGLESMHRMRPDLEAGMSLGEEARVLTNAPTKLIIIDDRVAMIPLEPASASLVSMIVVHPSGLLEALCSLFEDLWRRSLPLTLPDLARQMSDPGSPDRPTQEELRLLNLLATGITDDAIAKHLGVSHRTVQRRLRALLDRLDAETRFQAGLQAGRRGWLA
jgi:DNA-binding NarL/FixJ family response regulator